MIIYAHKRVDNGAIFYIGASGNLKRAYSKCSRSKKWRGQCYALNDI